MTGTATSGSSRKIANDVLAVLSGALCAGNQLILTGTLDRKLYVKANEVLEAAGGKWNRKLKSHVFDGDAYEAIDAVIVTGEIVTKKTLQQEFGYFPTPSDVVAKLLDLAEIKPGMKCLEPSAGKGAIAKRLKDMGCTPICCELLTDNANELIYALGISGVLVGDFLELDPAKFIDFDRIIMNPPFAMQADIKHVTHALKFLKRGGILVAVMSSGVTFRQDKRTREFSDLINSFSEFELQALPEGSFKESGTGVNTVTLKVRK